MPQSSESHSLPATAACTRRDARNETFLRGIAVSLDGTGTVEAGSKIFLRAARNSDGTKVGSFREASISL